MRRLCIRRAREAMFAFPSCRKHPGMPGVLWRLRALLSSPFCLFAHTEIAGGLLFSCPLLAPCRSALRFVDFVPKSTERRHNASNVRFSRRGICEHCTSTGVRIRCASAAHLAQATRHGLAIASPLPTGVSCSGPRVGQQLDVPPLVSASRCLWSRYAYIARRDGITGQWRTGWPHGWHASGMHQGSSVSERGWKVTGETAAERKRWGGLKREDRKGTRNGRGKGARPKSPFSSTKVGLCLAADRTAQWPPLSRASSFCVLFSRLPAFSCFVLVLLAFPFSSYPWLLHVRFSGSQAAIFFLDLATAVTPSLRECVCGAE